MRITRSSRSFMRGLLAIFCAAAVMFTAVAPAHAGIIYLHAPYAPHHWIPDDIVEAEDWLYAVDIENQPTSDVGGGEHLGLIHDGDWTEYVLASGGTSDGGNSYFANFRVASATSGGTITMTVDDVDVGSVDVNNTGGWQNWTTVSTVVQINPSEVLRLTFNGDSADRLLNLNWVEFEPLVTGGPLPLSEEDQRRNAINELITGLESFGAANGTYSVVGGGWTGSGQGWAYWEDANTTSTANMLIAGGHLAPDPLHDQLWTDPSSIVGDVLVYVCAERVGVFTREGGGTTSTHDQNWWDTNGCNRYPIDRLGVSYFILSAPL